MNSGAGDGNISGHPLKDPLFASILMNAAVPWFVVSVDSHMTRHLLIHARAVEQEIAAIDCALRLGIGNSLRTRTTSRMTS